MQPMEETVIRLEDRLEGLADKFASGAEHQEKMWGRIDEVVHSLTELKVLFDSSGVSTIQSLNSRLTQLEYRSASLWGYLNPAIYIAVGILVTKFFGLVIK